MKFVVIGSINTDLVINTDRVPKIGETISGKGFSTNCGGKGANQAIAAAKLGGEVSFIGAVGKDANGDIALQNFQKFGIHTQAVERVDVNTGVAVITVCNGDNSIILDAGANGEVTKELIDKHMDVIKSADAIIMQLEIPMETVVYAAKRARDVGVKVVLNPAPIQELPKELLSNTDVIILNETETEVLTKVYPDTEKNRKKCMDTLKQLGISQVIITLGGDGCVYNDGDALVHQSAFSANVVDTTAAGDTFIGAFCLKMNEGLKNAVTFATAASSITVSRAGASESIPSKEEVEEKLKTL